MPDDSELTVLVVTYVTAVNQLQQKCADFEKSRDSLAETKLVRAEAALAALDINEDIVRLQASFNELKVKFAPGLSPPSQQLVTNATNLATAVGQVLAEEKVTQVILQSITAFVDNWTALVTGVPPAAVPTPAGTTGAQAAPGTVARAGANKKFTNSQWFAEHHKPNEGIG